MMVKLAQVCDNNDIPVICSTGLLVVGGSLAGLAAAVAHAEAGNSTMVIDRRTFVGTELTYWQRPWVHWKQRDAELFRQWFGLIGDHAEDEYVALHMNDLKVALEDRLLSSGPEILYLTQPVAVQHAGSGFEVIVANKSGRQAIRCSAILDATEEGIVQRLLSGDASAFAPMELDCTIRVRRVIDFTDVIDGWQTSYDVPERLGVVGNQIGVQRGGYDPGHVFVDIPMDLPYAAALTLQADMEMEYQARNRSFEVACWLHQNVEEFDSALFAPGSFGVMRGDHFDPAEALRMGGGLSLADGEILSLNDVRLLPHCECKSDKELFCYSEHSEYKLFCGATEYSSWKTERLPILTECDVAVAGGGVAGAVAGFASAREGARTVVAEMHHALGGVGTIGAVNMYWLSNENAYSAEIDSMVLKESARAGFPEQYSISGRGPEEGTTGEFSSYSKDFLWNVEVKEKVLLELCRQAGADVYLNCLLCGTLMQGSVVKGIVIATPYGPAAILAKATVDATGDGDAAVFSGAQYVFGNGRDRVPMWAAMSPMGKPGRYRSNFHALVDIGDAVDYTRFILATRRRNEGARVYDHAGYLSPRESRHIVGDYRATLLDQLMIRQFEDTISIAFSNYDCKGKSAADIVYLGVNPPNYDIEIPYRAFLPKDIEGIVLTGRAFSCTHDAIAAPRMQKDIQQVGCAGGIAAALSALAGLSPRQLPYQTIQKRLMETGNLPSRVHGRVIADPQWDVQTLVNGLTGKEPIDWLVMDSRDKLTEIPVFLKLCFSKPEQAVPILLGAFRQSAGQRRLIQARLLIWHRCNDEELLDYIMHEIFTELSGPVLPKRTGDIYFLVFAPDQGIMPEVLYLVNMLHRIGDERVLRVYEAIVGKLEGMQRDFKDRRAGIFDYIESVAYAAERICLEAFKPLLKRLMALPEMQGIVMEKGYEPDFMRDRLVYLGIIIARALARCGSRDGLEALLDFAGDNRAVYAKSAIDELAAVTGMNHYRDLAAWRMTVGGMPENFPPVPWTVVCE